MDMTVNEGPLKFKGVTAKAIYALDGEHLVWCPAEPGAKDRPKAFPPTDSQEFLCIVFRRESLTASRIKLRHLRARNSLVRRGAG